MQVKVDISEELEQNQAYTLAQMPSKSVTFSASYVAFSPYMSCKIFLFIIVWSPNEEYPVLKHSLVGQDIEYRWTTEALSSSFRRNHKQGKEDCIPGNIDIYLFLQ